MYKELESEKTFEYKTKYGTFAFQVKGSADNGRIYIDLPFSLNGTAIHKGAGCTIDSERCAFVLEHAYYSQDIGEVISIIPLPAIDEPLDEIQRVKSELESQVLEEMTRYDSENLRDDTQIVLVPSEQTGLFASETLKSARMKELEEMWTELFEEGYLSFLLDRLSPFVFRPEHQKPSYEVPFATLRSLVCETYVEYIYPLAGRAPVEKMKAEEQQKAEKEHRQLCLDLAKATNKRKRIRKYTQFATEDWKRVASIYAEPDGTLTTEVEIVYADEPLFESL